MENSHTARDWGLFGRALCAPAGALFLIAGAVCFFAYNWAAMPAFAKFGCVIAPMIALGALTLWRGLDGLTGSLALLACGLLAGPLLAVFGQVYQTGANAWELFRGWSLLLIPLAIISRRAGLWAALWLVASLWAILYVVQENGVIYDNPLYSSRLFYITAGETAFLTLWELAAYNSTLKDRPLCRNSPVLRAHWLPRCVGLALMVWLTGLLVPFVSDLGREVDQGTGVTLNLLLYCCLTGVGAYWYTRKRRDLFLLACGLMSLICLLLTLEGRSLRFGRGGENEIAILLLMACTLIACGAGAGKLLLYLHRQEKNNAPPDETPADNEDAPPDNRSPWTARLLMGLCAWVTVPVLIGLAGLLFGFSTDGFIGLSLFALGLGLALSRVPGVFAGQAALCLCLAGTGAASLLIAAQLHLRIWALLPGIVLLMLSGALSKSAAYRCIAAATVIPLIFCQAAYAYTTGFSLPLSVARPLFACLYALFGVGLAYLWSKPQTTSTSVNSRPFLIGAFAALLILGLIPFLFYKMFLLHGLGRGFEFVNIPLGMVGLGAGIGLLVFVWRMCGELQVRQTNRAIAGIFCVLITALSYRMPWMGVGIFALILARRSLSHPLLGAAVLYLAASTVFEYYCLASTLLVKSYSLGAMGLVLLVFACVLHRLTAPEENAPPLPANRRRLGIPDVALAVSLGLFFALFGLSVHGKEALLANGRVVILALRPLDPRSLMQGDYMTLNFALEQDIRKTLRKDEQLVEEYGGKGKVRISPGKDGVYGLSQSDDASDGAHGVDDTLLVYRTNDRSVRICSGSFLFQEGHARAYDAARFAELRVDEDGNCLITHLLDSDRQRIRAE